MQLKRLFNRLKSVWAESGFSGVVRLFAGRLLVRHWTSYVYALVTPARPARIVWPETESLVIYNADGPPIPPTLCDLIRRYERDLPECIHHGDWLYAVLVNGECQHFGGVGFSSRQIRILGERSRIPLIGACNTVPEARGRGLYRRALAELGTRLQAAGYERVLIETKPENYASQRGIDAAGYQLQRIMSIWIFFSVIAFATIRINSSVSRKLWRI